MNGYEFAEGHDRIVLPLECLCAFCFPDPVLWPQQAASSPLKVQVLKPHSFLPCEENGVGTLGVFLARNRDDEFAVGHNPRENHIFLYINK